MKEVRSKKKLKVIGWRELVSLPDLGIFSIKAKVDSGAQTCALHATRIRILKKTNGEKMVSFYVTAQMEPHHSVRVRAPLVEMRKVKSSLGHTSVRPVIRTNIRIGDETWSTEITLVNRDPMGFRMLLGRRSLKGRYLIHPSRSFIQSRTESEENK